MRKPWGLLFLVPLLLTGCAEWQWSGGEPSGPVAVFRAEPQHGAPPLTVVFDASRSVGDIVSYAWDFGDGYTGKGVTVEHTYRLAGVYEVHLLVTDSQGHKDTATGTILVQNPHPPIAINGIKIEMVTDPPYWWNPAEWPENYFPEGMILKFTLLYDDNPDDNISVVSIQWRVDRITGSPYEGYLWGHGNPWVPTEKPFIGASCGVCEAWQYRVYADLTDSTGEVHSAYADFWAQPYCAGGSSP